MFALTGEPTLVRQAANAMIHGAGLPLDPRTKDSLAITLFRADPLNHSPYLLDHAGLLEPEPMYGPDITNPSRYDLGTPRFKHHILGFKAREETTSVKAFGNRRWHLYVNERAPGLLTRLEPELEELIHKLEKLLGASQSEPLYPELWQQEILGRDDLRESIRSLAPSSSVEEHARQLGASLSMRFSRAVPVALGIYLRTADSWQLCGSNPIRDHLPEKICANAPRVQNAFDWASASGRSLLIGPESKRWHSRVAACGAVMANSIHHSDFSGMCIVPLLHVQQPRSCVGMILLSGRGMPIFPGHCYLLSRLAMELSVHLTPLLLPGMYWIPDGKLSRGNAVVEYPLPTTKKVSVEVVQSIVEDLMPTSSRVKIEALGDGHSGAETFRLTVVDANGINEVPRVLKLGEYSKIHDEMRRFSRYAKNKKVGGASQVEIVEGFWWPREADSNTEQKHYAAVIYTLVGAGERVEPWSKWSLTAPPEELSVACEMLRDQLSCWTDRTRGADGRTVVELVIEPLVSTLQNYLDPTLPIKPSFDEVRAVLSKLATFNWDGLVVPARTCIVHGDLHGDNAFVILTRTRHLRSVALIDWGSISSGRHPLSDISKLAVDLIYRVKVNYRLQELMIDTVKKWGVKLGCGELDWAFVMVHQIAKILFYRAGSNYRQPFIDEDARAAAWQFFSELVDGLLSRAIQQPPIAG